MSIDGRAVMSCGVTIRELEGADITTIEGLSADRSHGNGILYDEFDFDDDGKPTRSDDNGTHQANNKRQRRRRGHSPWLTDPIGHHFRTIPVGL